MTVVFRRLTSILWLPSSSRGGSDLIHSKKNLATFQPTFVISASTKSTKRMASSDNNNNAVFSIDDLLCLAGTYQGEGHVLKSTGETAATYTEVAEFKPVRKTDDFVVYRHVQETKHAVKNVPMHTETGFLKLLRDGTAVASYAHPFPSGFIDEISTGSLVKGGDTKTLTLTAKDFQRAADLDNSPPPQTGKKQVQGFQRVYTLDSDGKLSYKQYLSTDKGGDNLYHHLTCTFTKNNK